MTSEEIILELLRTLGYVRKTLVLSHVHMALQYHGVQHIVRETEWAVECIDKVFHEVGPNLTDVMKKQYFESSKCPKDMPLDYRGYDVRQAQEGRP